MAILGCLLFAFTSGELVADAKHGLAISETEGPAPATTNLWPDASNSSVARQTRRIANPQSSVQADISAMTVCDINEFATLSGASLLTYLRSVVGDCATQQLFNVEGEQAASIFTIDKINSVAQGFQENAASYQGRNENGILNEVSFLRAAYFVAFNEPAIEDFNSLVDATQVAVQAAIHEFIDNPNYSNVSDEHGVVLSEVVILIDSAELVVDFLPELIALLNNFDESYTNHFQMVVSVNSVYSGLFRVRDYDLQRYLIATEDDPTVLDVLNGFIERHGYLDGTEFAYIWNNAGGEIARFLQDGSSNAALAKNYATAILTNYDSIGPGVGLYTTTANQVLFYDGDNCADYGICTLSADLESQILGQTFECNDSLVIRYQDLKITQRDEICELLIDEANLFHNLLETDRQPLANDFNDTLEIIVFDSVGDYGLYAGLIYGIDTNNGGIYIEGDPSASTNQARYFAYEEDSNDPDVNAGVRNLKHEYVHYLDGHFNTAGDFSDILDAGIVWWVEGLAEYVSKQSTNDEAVVAGRSKALQFSEVLNTDYNDNVETLYRWSYLAVRFLFEEKRNEVDTLLGFFREGDYQGLPTSYENYVGVIGVSFDQEFHAWIDSLTDTGSAPGVTTSFIDSTVAGSGGGINSTVSIIDGGITFTWTPPTPNTYSLWLGIEGNSEPLLFGGHDAGSAEINYDQLGLQGDEVLTGYFVLYAEDSSFLEQAPSFNLDLSELNGLRTDASIRQYLCEDEFVPLLLSIDNLFQVFVDLHLVSQSPVQFQARDIKSNLAVENEEAGIYDSLLNVLTLSNISLNCENGSYQLRLFLRDADALIFAAFSDGVTRLN